jgi:glucokinase
MSPSQHAPESCSRLVADIGGSNARFALVDDAGAMVAPAAMECARYTGVVEAAGAYLSDREVAVSVTEACFSVACPAHGDRIALTNSPWSFSVEETRHALGLDRLRVINDYTAQALAVPYLTPADTVQVGPGTPVPGAPIAVLGPGTGLGVSGLLGVGGGHVPLAGEGGHVSWAPGDERETNILHILRDRFGHVSAERLLSGPGIENLHAAVAELRRAPNEKLDAAEITGRAVSGHDPLCAEVLEIFCSALGGVAGDLALILGARGGVFVTGGIVPRLGDYVAASPFRRRFEDKGRFAAYLAAIPTYLVIAQSPGLLGAVAALRGD